MTSDRQRRISQWLARIDKEKELANLYEGAAKLFTDGGFPGRERFICHAVREIGNRLPQAVGGGTAREYLQYNKEVEGLAGVWEGRGLAGVHIGGDREAPTDATVGVPVEVAVMVERLVEKHRAVLGRRKHNAKQLFLSLEPENEKFTASLLPVVGQWLDITKWFGERAHVGSDINPDELASYFEKFETVLDSLGSYFYEGLDHIEKMVSGLNDIRRAPTDAEVTAVVGHLGRPRYRLVFFDKLENPSWIEPLKDRGFFMVPEDPPIGEPYEGWPQGWYLRRMACRVPQSVLDVITEIRTKNPYVCHACLECLAEMPVDVSVKGVKLVRRLLGTMEYSPWFGVGESAAKLMVRLVDRHPAAGFVLAESLLELRQPEDKSEYSFERMRSKFRTHEYKELVFTYYRKVWEMMPLKATCMLVEVLDRYLTEYSKEKGYDTSEFLGTVMEDLENVGDLDYDFGAIVVKAICEAGRVVTKREPESVGKLLDELERRDKAIFCRVVMYLLRFVPMGAEKERISKFVGDPRFFEGRRGVYEHRKLLNEKFDDVTDAAKRRFTDWVEEPKFGAELRADIENRCKASDQPLPDWENQENKEKARELYLVRERFKDLYEQHRRAAKADDVALAPQPMVSMARAVGPTEGSPMTTDDMLKRAPGDVIAFISDPSQWVIPKDEWGIVHGPEVALSYVFQEVVKSKSHDYAGLSDAAILALEPPFVRGYLLGMWGAIQEDQGKGERIGRLLQLIRQIVEQKREQKEYASVLHALIYPIEALFENRETRPGLVLPNSDDIWAIIAPLVTYKGEEFAVQPSHDLHQQAINYLPGQAAATVMQFALAWKNADLEKYKQEWSGRVRGVMEQIVSAEDMRVRSVMGAWFPQVHWLEAEWTDKNLDWIFPPQDDRVWDAVWGTYMAWGRTYKDTFGLLKGRGKYEHAIERIGADIHFKHERKPEEGLMQHLMIAYFRGWAGLDESLLKAFFARASAELRAKAARFLKPDFDDLKDLDAEKRELITARVKEYWAARLSAIATNPEENRREAMELNGWVVDSPLSEDDTLGLLQRGLEVSGGQIGEMSYAAKFVEAIGELGKRSSGREPAALRCLKMAAADRNMHMTWSGMQKPLVSYLDSMVGLSDDIVRQARQIADLYGRYNPQTFRDVWVKLGGDTADSK